MRLDKIEIVSAEMEELQRRIVSLYKADKCSREDDHYYVDPSKESAAIKRKSMDLSRALTEMRRP